MSKKPVYLMVLVIVLMEVLGVSFNVHKVEAPYPIIYIKADGSIDPPTANITSPDNVTYTFTDNINASIVVERSNIIVDGDGHTLDGLGSLLYGFNLTSVSNVTIRNVNVMGFGYGIYLQSSTLSIISENNITFNEGNIYLGNSFNNTITGNTITDGAEAIQLYASSNNTISGNSMSDNYNGVWSRLNSVENVISGNNITANTNNGIHLEDSSDNTISGNNITNNEYGIWLWDSSNNTLRNNDASDNKYNFGVYGWSLSSYIQDIDDSNTVNGKPIYYWVNGRDFAVPLDAGYVALVNCTNITVKNLNLANNGEGILLWYATNSTITKNKITNNWYGIWLAYSSNNSISGNNITGNSHNGIYLYSSSDNTILSNTFSSNLSNGIYLQKSSDNTILKNMDFSDSGYGICLWQSSHRNIVSENMLSTIDRGIVMGYSDDNRILNNTVSRTDVSGIEIQQICNNSIIANNMVSESNLCGISISSENEETRYNAIVGNNIMHSLIGIRITRLSGNVIYHNNFVDNTNQTSISNSANIWDDSYPSGGNYWSDYTGVDSNRDGIGDSWYNITGGNIDHYPLMGPFHSFNTTLGKYVNVISNSTIDSFRYFESNSTIRMYVSNMTATQTFGFCRVCVPKGLMSPPYTVIIDDGLTEVLYFNGTVYDNGTHIWIYFAYEHSTHKVEIIPEFPTWTSMLLILILLTVALAICKRRLFRNSIPTKVSE